MAINEGSTIGEPGPGEPEAEAERGGCLKLGWGCLPVMLGLLAVPSLLTMLY